MDADSPMPKVMFAQEGKEQSSVTRRVASPRCVMEQQHQQQQQQQQHLPLSPVARLERYNRHVVRQAKLWMVKSRYKEALKVGNDYLQQQLRDGWSGPLSYFQTTVKLATPFLLPNKVSQQDEQQSVYFFQVRLGTQLTAVDELATIVLQSWYEIAKQDVDSVRAWQHLLPLLKLYSLHPMPIQLFVQIWVPFWHSFPLVDGRSLALSWSLQVAVLLVEQSIRFDATHQPLLLKELREELVEFLFLKQILKVRDKTLLQQMIKAVLAPQNESWEPLIHQISNNSLENENDSKNDTLSLHVLWGMLNDAQNQDEWPGLSAELRDRLLNHETLKAMPLSSDLSLSTQDSSTPSSMFQLDSKGLPQRLQSLLPPSLGVLWQRLRDFATNVRGNLGTDASLAQDRNVLQRQRLQLAISIVSLLLAWRNRGILRHLTKAAATALLAPITELVEALTPTKPRLQRS